MEERPAIPTSFTRARLPWIVAAAALALYLATLCQWVTLASLPAVATVAGWNWWEPVLVKPLFHLVTLPVRWLPPDARPLVLNVFSAACAALALALLARSVALLPQDRTREQRSRLHGENGLLDGPLAWLPPLLAVFALGLQHTFWEHATAATGEMLNLLVFAAIIRCLLEFRASRQDAWLVKAAVFYALGAADNYALVGFFPLAVGAFVMLKGRGVFASRFVLSLLACAAAGGALYLVPPWLMARDPDTAGTFLEWLRLELGTQKNNLLGFPRSRAVILALISVVPAVLLCVRWPSTFGDTSALGAALTNFLFRVVHVAFLVLGVWVAFDPVFGTRALGQGVPFLTFSFLGALATGYFAGYFLLLARGGGNSWRQEALPLRTINQLCAAAVCVAVISVPLVLVKRNLPAVRAQNGPALRQFAEFTRDALPEKAVLLSGNPFLLQLQTAVADPGRTAPLVVDMRWLPVVSYHRRLARHYPGRWPAVPADLPGTNTFTAAGLVQGLTALGANNALIFLQPPHGTLLLENHYAVPRGPVTELRPYPAGAVLPPAESATEIAANQNRWAAAVARFPGLRDASTLGAPDAPHIARLYSAALNEWGAGLQRAGLLAEAERNYTTAWQLNTNPVARLNLDVNQLLRAGRPVGTNFAARAAALLREHRAWGSLLAAHGAPDEPELALQAGQALLGEGLVRQAIHQFLRAAALNPANLTPRVALAEAFLQVRRPDDAAAQLQAIRVAPDYVANKSDTREAILLRLDALVQLNKTNHAAAEQLLLRARALQPDNPTVLDSLSQLYLIQDRLTNALATLDALLQLAPDYQRALLNQSAVLIRLGSSDKAVALLDHALKLQPANVPALLNRGQAQLTLKRVDAAEHDYREALRLAPGSASAQFGLGEVALARGQIAEAKKLFETGLRSADPNSFDAKKAAARLKEFSAAPK